MRKNVASQVIGAQMVTASDGSAFTGTVTVYITGDAGSQAIGSVGSGVCTHEGNGYHTYAPAQAETNYNLIAFTFIGSGAVPVTIQVFTISYDPHDTVRLGLTALPNAAADAAGGLTISDAGGLDLDTLLGRLTANVATEAKQDIIDTIVDAIKAVTDNLPDNGALTTIASNISAILTDTGTDLPATLATIAGYLDTEIAAILADTNELQIDWANGGRLDLLIDAIKAKTDNLPADPTSADKILAYIQLLARSDSGIETDRSTELGEINNNEGSGAGDFSSQADSHEAIRDRGDAAWTTGGGGSISDILNVQALIPFEIDLANTVTVRIALGLTNMVDDLPTTTEITPGTITIDRKAIGGTSWSNVVNAAACSEVNGLIYYDEVFDSGTGYTEGDSIRITFKSQKITVAANDYEITGTDGWTFQTSIRQTVSTAAENRAEMDSNSTQLAAIVGDTNELQTDWANGGRLDLLIDAIKAVTDNLPDSGALTTIDGIVDAIKAVTDNLPDSGALTTIAGNITAILTDTGTDLPATLATIAGYLDTEIAAILADTNELQTDWANGGRLDLLIDAIKAVTDNIPDSGALTTIASNISAILTDTGTDIPATLATIAGYLDTEIAAILADTNELQTDWANGGRLDLLIDAIKAVTDNIPDSGALTTISGKIDTIDTVVDAIKVITDALGASAAAMLALSAGVIVAGTVSHDNSVATTTEFWCDDITEATADHFNGRIVIFTSGALQYQATDITDYELDTGEGHFTVTALTEAPADDVTFIIV